MSELRDAALDYAARGWPVFPVDAHKEPLTTHGFQDASTDPERIRAWWRANPEAGIGVATGEPSGLFVVDIDTHKGGAGTWKKLTREHGKVPETAATLTGNGGSHLLFCHPGNVGNSSGRLGRAIDVRADGGYAVLPPSPHESGRPYRWLVPIEKGIAEPPAWLVELARGRRNGAAPAIADVIPEGERNATLASIAGSLRRPGLSEAAILAALRVENQRCRPSPLPDCEVEQIARSVAQYAPAASVTSFQQQEDEASAPSARLRTRSVDLARVRPTRWLWKRRIPLGLPSLIVGEEGIGKGTLTAWMIARATRGELEGDLHEQPIRVLVVGDEDAFEPIWVPRLHAADADLEMLRTLDDGEYIEDFRSVADALEAAIVQEGIGLVLLDALLDHIPGGSAGEAIYNPKNVRQALQPLRRIAAATDVAMVGLLHPIKSNPSSFRQLVAGSHQFNAVSRSSLLLAPDPTDEHLRILVRGKGNHSAAPRSIEFSIAADVVDLNGHTFEMPKAVNVCEGERTLKDLLKSGPAANPVRDALAAELEVLLTGEPQSLAALAEAVGRSPKDGSVRNALKWLADQKRAVRSAKGWLHP